MPFRYPHVRTDAESVRPHRPHSAAAPASTAATAPASTAGGAKVGIIDVQQVIVATNEGQRDFEQLQKKFDPKRNELQNLSKEVDRLKSQLNTQGEKMNEDARAKLVKDIEAKQKVLQRQAEDAQNEFQQEQNTIAQRILQKLGPVIDKYAKDNGFRIADRFLEPVAAGSSALGEPGGGHQQDDRRPVQHRLGRTGAAEVGNRRARASPQA